MAKKVSLQEKKDSRAITVDRSLPEYMKHELHTIHIPEVEGEQAWVDVRYSGTEKVGNKEMPVNRKYWIQRGVDVMNVPTPVVHILVDTAIETRYRQEERPTRDGGRKKVFVPYKRKSYPCSIIESYDEPKDVETGQVAAKDMSGGIEET